MRILLLIPLFFLSIQGYSQEPIEKNVGDFTTVKVFDLIHISLVKSDTNKVIITGKDAENVEIINKNGLLKIRMKLDKIFNGADTFVAVHYTELSLIDGNEGARIVANELIEQEYLELKAQEGAVLRIGMLVNKLAVKAVSGGIIETHGKTKSQDVIINTGGIYQGKACESEDARVRITTGGEVEVFSSETVDVRITAGGQVDIYGHPKTVLKKTNLGGRIKLK